MPPRAKNVDGRVRRPTPIIRLCRRHTPRRRGIQYAAALEIASRCRGLLDRPPSRTMTENASPANRRGWPGQSRPVSRMQFSPEIIFILSLALRMAITAAFVVSASVITERSGPVIGALVATLPISAGPSYVFLALDHDAAFIAEGALASLPINAATIFLGLTYVVLAQRHGALLSAAAAIAVWIALASMVRTFHWSLMTGLIANAIAFAICVPLLARYRHVKMPPVARRWYDIPLRASLVATLVATVVTASGWVGPKVSGIIALFPVVFTSMMLILHPRIGGPPTAAVF